MVELLGETPLSFYSQIAFDGEKFPAEAHLKYAEKEFVLTVGTHLGKPLLPNSQIKAGG